MKIYEIGINPNANPKVGSVIPRNRTADEVILAIINPKKATVRKVRWYEFWLES